MRENSIYTHEQGMRSSIAAVELEDIDSVSDSIASITHLLNNTSAFTTSVDQVILTVQGANSVTAASLASDISQWIMESEDGLSTSKLNLLCSPVFQCIARTHFGDHLMRDFRLLIWATTLLSSATVQPEQAAHVQAEKSLTKLVSYYGQAVLLEVDKLCKYRNIKSLSSEQILLLFTILIGLCLSASYFSPGGNEITVS